MSEEYITHDIIKEFLEKNLQTLVDETNERLKIFTNDYKFALIKIDTTCPKTD